MPYHVGSIDGPMIRGESAVLTLRFARAGREMTAPQVVHVLEALQPDVGAQWVVCGGAAPDGEVDDALVAALHDAGFWVAMETAGGLRPPPGGVDWLGSRW